MPSERRGTVTEDIGAYIRRLKGTSEWKGDKTGTIRAPIAKVCGGEIDYSADTHACASCIIPWRTL